MALQSHISELAVRHRQLEHEIEEEMLRPGCDTLRVTALKRRKLRLKEEIERLRHEHENAH